MTRQAVAAWATYYASAWAAGRISTRAAMGHMRRLGEAFDALPAADRHAMQVEHGRARLSAVATVGEA